MLIISDYIEPAELTGYVRAALADRQVNQPGLARWLPNRVVDDLVYRFTKGGNGLTEAATYRAWDTPAPVSKRPGFTRTEGELPPISRSLRLDEYTRLRTRTNADQAIRNAILNDADRLVREILMRFEIARGQALVEAQVVINENGVQGSVVFGRDSSMSVAPATLWTDATNADPFVNLRTWNDAYEDRNGESPGALLMSSRGVGLMLAAEKVRVRAGSLLGTPSDITRAQLNQMLEDRELPPIYTYNVRYKAANGSAARVIPDDKVLLLPAPVAPDDWEGTDLGATLFGTTAEALEPNYELADSDAPGLVAGSYRTQNPVAVWTLASAVGLPVEANPDLAMVADVA
ncbi:major capsid protein [Polymorphospora rubra]|uniref:major capsid protein n=1 Tax=Polymorphospora rubra TaxID=338584 RepID=UPI0033C79895